ncbi:hypothetical protein GLOIN_2v1764040 [Rhizophagus irregularis DAOM 181602=DAOM 197198]|nr:hypothetical protein GLOIN_2v1764040 [Rhizophagus irregularis DAOM 181602=DAOM 197198]
MSNNRRTCVSHQPYFFKNKIYNFVKNPDRINILAEHNSQNNKIDHANSIFRQWKTHTSKRFTPSERSRNNKSAFLELVREYFDLENLALQLLQTVEHLQYRDKDRIPDLNDYKFLVPLFSFKTRTLTKLENSIKEKSVITAHAASSSSHTTPLVDTDSDELRLKYVKKQ